LKDNHKSQYQNHPNPDYISGPDTTRSTIVTTLHDPYLFWTSLVSDFHLCRPSAHEEQAKKGNQAGAPIILLITMGQA